MTIKVSQLTEDTSPTSDDYVLAVDNATSASKKVTLTNVVKAGLPTQASQSGKFLTTDGSTTSWAAVSGAGTGDVTGPSSSVDSEVALFSSTTGKLLKRASITGLVKLTSGVLSAAAAGTDYLAPAAIGVTLQGYDAELAALAGLTSAADKLPYFTGSGTAGLADFTSFGRSLVDDADATTARATLGLTIGTNVQAYDAELAALAGLTSAADRLPYFTGSGTASLATFTTAGRALVDDADASAQRTTLGLVIGTDVLAPSGNGSALTGITESQVTNLVTDLAAKQPLDSDLTTIAGLTATTDNFMIGASSAWASRTPAQARTSLGLVIGTNVQAWDADLDSIAGLTATTDNFIVSVASAWASRTPAQVRTTLALVIGTNVQAWDTDLDAIAALSPTNDDIVQRKAGAWTNRTMAQLKTDLVLVKGDVGLGSVDNTSDATKASATTTFTNKRITKRTGTTTSSATPTINTDNVDFYSITAQAAAITSFTTNLSGTPTEAQILWIAIKDDGTARAITWGSSFEASGNVALPTTTVISTRLDVGFVWNTATSKWRCVAVA